MKLFQQMKITIKDLRRIWKRGLCTGVILSMMLGLCACSKTGGIGNADSSKENGDQVENSTGNDLATTEAENRVSTPEQDWDVGLNSLSIDQLPQDITEQEAMTVDYFDQDYMFINSYETLQRYTPIFEDSLVECYVNVAKILSYEGDDFEVLVYMIENSDETYMGTYTGEERLMIVKGSSQDARVILGDNLLVRGRVTGMVSTDVDGVSIMVPEIQSVSGCILGGDYYYFPSRYSYDELKTFASGIFGEGILFREATGEERVGSSLPYYICTLENQSNIKLSSYAFYERVGKIDDFEHPEYDIQVGADGEHFLLFMYQYDVGVLTLEYYDNSLNCLWSREFTYSSVACCDLTQNNLYMCMGNELYIINMETGEDTFEPQFVGEKVAVHKYEEGIFMVSASETDTFMLADLQGNILWRMNGDRRIINLQSVQKVNDTLVIQDEEWIGMYDGSTKDMWNYYYVLDMNTGEIIRRGEVETDYFHNYG